MVLVDSFPKTDQNKVKRLPKKGVYDKVAIYKVVDEALVAHVGFSGEHGPVVIPMIYGRDGDKLYLHGSTASRFTKATKEDTAVCCTITLLDGLIFARSLFNHSMQYRSVMVFGQADEVTDEAEREHALRVITSHLLEGRWDDARSPSPAELKATRVIRVPIDSASMKASASPPDDEKADIVENKYWAGVVPMETTFGEPIPDPNHPPVADCPPGITNYSRSKQ